MITVIKYIRKIPLKKRFQVTFWALGLFPLCIIILANIILESSYHKKTNAKVFQNYAYETSVRVEDTFARLLQKFEYLTNNNDILTDLNLYDSHEEYHNLAVQKRIEDTMGSILATQKGVDYASITLQDSTGFLYGKMIVAPSTQEKQADQNLSWDHYDSGTKQYLLLKQKIYLQNEEGTSAVFTIAMSCRYLQKICDASKGSENQQITILDADENSIISSENKIQGNTYVVKNMIAGAPYTLVNTFPKENYWLFFYIKFLLMVLIMIGIISYVLYLLRESIMIPLQYILKRMKNPFQEQETAMQMNSSTDEHAILDEEFSDMIMRLNHLVEETYHKKIIEEDLHTKIRELELSALQQQINPHFFYNVLDNIGWLAQLQGYQQIREMITALGDFFKTSISEKGAYVTVRTEIENAKSYIRLQQLMHQGQFEDFWDISDDILDHKTIKLMLQPIIENCIVHGFENISEGGKIIITGRLFNNELEFTIQDNGQGMDEEQRLESLNYMDSEINDVQRSIGMKNIHQRIKIYFGRQYGIEIEPQIETGTVVTIRIPVGE